MRENWRAEMMLLTIGLILLTLSTLFGPMQTNFALAAEMKAVGESEWTKTVAAAKKEGKLAVFLYQRENIEAAVKAFEKKYPEIQLLRSPQFRDYAAAA
jgi:hypothetical protein